MLFDFSYLLLVIFKKKTVSEILPDVIPEDMDPVIVVLSSCTEGSKPDPKCDPALEAEVVKPDKCGKIKDTKGPFR